jgi:hypothetical protein
MRKSPQTPFSRDEALSAVREVYTALDARPVERACVRRTECCRFRLTGEMPYLTRGEAWVAAEALLQKGIQRLPQKTDGSCPLLQEGSGQCTVYEARPFGCRTHFCGAAGGPYARREIQDLVWRLDSIDTRLGGDGGQRLPHALQTALDHAKAHREKRPRGQSVRDAARLHAR